MRSASYAPPAAQAAGKTKKAGGKPKLIAALAAVFIIAIAVVALVPTGFLGSLFSGNTTPNAASPNPGATASGTVYPSWFDVNNWYSDQIVRYVAVDLATGGSYTANYAVAPWPGNVQDPSTGTLALPIPGNGDYKVTVYTASGQSVWWNSIYLNVQNQGNPANLVLAKVQSDYGQSSGNLNTSTLDNIPCSGSG